MHMLREPRHCCNANRRDGSIRRMKAAAAARRVQNSKDQWTTLEQYCMDGGLPNGQSSLPAPPLMTQQLYSTLYSLNVPVSSDYVSLAEHLA
jgi:hypothetical protein